MDSTLAGMVRVGASYFAFPTQAPSEWYKNQLAKENRVNDFDRYEQRQASAAREEAAQYVERFNQGVTVHNPDLDEAQIEPDGPDDFAISVYDGEFGHVRLKHFTGPLALETFVKWTEAREMGLVAA